MEHSVHKSRVAIVGAGISGLHTAYQLLEAGYEVKVFEARSRAGGRIQSHISDREVDNGFDRARFDLGPSWFWRGQPRIEALIEVLGLSSSVFEQNLKGDGLYEPIKGGIQRGRLGFSMAGSMRLEGGMQSVIDRLLERIIERGGENSVEFGSMVSKVSTLSETCERKLELTTGGKIEKFDYIVMALPPRIIVRDIEFSPPLSQQCRGEMSNTATWMAGQAKAVIEYERPFWRELGLSGDVISQQGPLAEIHDASIDRSEAYALFGFISIPPSQRANLNSQVVDQIKHQLVRVFGEAAENPIRVHYQDWAREIQTSTELDQSIPKYHPFNLWPSEHSNDFSDCLIWSGSESAPSHFSGYIEGALEASEIAIEKIHESQGHITTVKSRP